MSELRHALFDVGTGVDDDCFPVDESKVAHVVKKLWRELEFEDEFCATSLALRYFGEGQLVLFGSPERLVDRGLLWRVTHDLARVL